MYVASFLAPKPHLLFFVLIELDIVKTLPRCYLQTYIEEPFLQKKQHRQQHRIPLDAAAMKATIREKITQDLRCLIFLHFQVQIKHII